MMNAIWKGPKGMYQLRTLQCLWGNKRLSQDHLVPVDESVYNLWDLVNCLSKP
jgi:hypothetical protein